ncbi:MAG TPA: tetratricopeptide repeat protein, partial [Sphingobacteriaceae bacterium]|nr:tetratricopeptide repeat protein [Sphingobacteriaceae bacterium]
MLIIPTLSFSQDWNQKFAHINQLIQAQDWEVALKDNNLLLTELEKELGNTHLYYVMGLNNAANIYRSTEQYELAIETYKRSHEIARLHFAADAPEMEFYDRNLAFLYFDTQKITPAIQHYENLLNILKEPHPENDYWIYYIDLAECYNRVRNNELTIQFFQTLDENYENQQISQQLSRGRIWSLLGTAHKFLTQYEASETYLVKAYDDCLLHRDSTACIIPMENIGDLYMLTNDYVKAKKYYGQAWELQKDKSEYDQYFVGVTENLITANLETGDGAEVRKYTSFLWDYLAKYQQQNLYLSFRSGLEYFEREEKSDLYEFALLYQLEYLKKHDQKHNIYQEVLNKLGYFYRDQGVYGLSADYLRLAVDNTQKTKTDTHRELLPLLDALIEVLEKNDKAADVQTFALVREKVRQANPGADPTEINANVNKLTRASALQQQGALDEALQLIIEIEPFFTKIQKEELLAYLTFLLVKSNIYIALDQFEVAAPWLREGYVLSEDNPEYVLQNVAFISKIGQYYEMVGDFESMASFMNSAIHILQKYPQKKGIIEPYYVRLARAYIQLEEWVSASQILTSTLPVLIEVYGEHNMHVLSAKNDLAALFAKSGEMENAIAQYLDMLTTSADHLSAKSKQTIYFNLANCYIKLGDQDQAILNINRYIDFYLEEINTVFTFLSEDQKNKYIESTQNSYHYILNFYHSLDDKGPVLEDIYRLQNAFKGMVLQSSVDIKQRWKSLEDPKALALFEEWQQARQAQNILQFEDNEEELRLITQKLDGLEREMSRMIPDYASQKLLNEGSWKDLQTKLGDDEAVIEFIQFEIGDVWDGWENDQQYAALIVAKGQSILKYVPLFKQS